MVRSTEGEGDRVGTHHARTMLRTIGPCFRAKRSLVSAGPITLTLDATRLDRRVKRPGAYLSRSRGRGDPHPTRTERAKTSQVNSWSPRCNAAPLIVCFTPGTYRLPIPPRSVQQSKPVVESMVCPELRPFIAIGFRAARRWQGATDQAATAVYSLSVGPLPGHRLWQERLWRRMIGPQHWLRFERAECRLTLDVGDVDRIDGQWSVIATFALQDRPDCGILAAGIANDPALGASGIDRGKGHIEVTDTVACSNDTAHGLHIVI